MEQTANTAKVLEDEVTVLKGEIKLILEEVRSAILSNESPFNASPGPHLISAPEAPVEALADQAAAPAPAPVAPPGAAPAAAAGAATPGAVQALSPVDPTALQPEQQTPRMLFGQPERLESLPSIRGDQPLPPGRSSMPLPQQISGEAGAFSRVKRADKTATPPRLDVTTLAALVVWIQESMAKLSSTDLSIVLSMARYTGLIEADLEATLARIGKASAGPHETGRAGIGDLLLHLRQIEALLKPADKPAANEPRNSWRRTA